MTESPEDRATTKNHCKPILNAIDMTGVDEVAENISRQRVEHLHASVHRQMDGHDGLNCLRRRRSDKILLGRNRKPQKSMASVQDRDLTVKVFGPPKATKRDFNFESSSTLSAMLTSMAMQMNTFIVDDMHVTGVVVSFEEGTLLVKHLQRPPHTIFSLKDSINELSIVFDNNKTDAEDLSTLFFQVISMHVYEVIIACLNQGLGPTADVLARMQAIISDMVVMMFIVVSPCKEWLNAFKAIRKNSMNAQPTIANTTIQQAYNLGKSKDATSQEQAIMKQFADRVLVRISRRVMQSDSEEARLSRLIKDMMRKWSSTDQEQSNGEQERLQKAAELLRQKKDEEEKENQRRLLAQQQKDKEEQDQNVGNNDAARWAAARKKWIADEDTRRTSLTNKVLNAENLNQQIPDQEQELRKYFAEQYDAFKEKHNALQLKLEELNKPAGHADRMTNGRDMIAKCYEGLSTTGPYFTLRVALEQGIKFVKTVATRGEVDNYSKQLAHTTSVIEKFLEKAYSRCHVQSRVVTSDFSARTPESSWWEDNPTTKWTINHAKEDRWSEEIDMEEKECLKYEQTTAEIKLSDDMSRAYVRAERLWRSFPVQVYSNMTLEQQVSYMNAVASGYDDRQYNNWITNKTPEGRHITAKHLLFYPFPETNNTQTWSMFCSSHVNPLITRNVKVEHFGGTERKACVEIYQYMAYLNTLEYQQAYIDLLENVQKNNSEIPIGRLKTVLVLNDKGAGLNQRFSFIPKRDQLQTQTFSFVDVKYATMMNHLPKNTVVNESDKKASLTIGPLHYLAQQDSFDERVREVAKHLRVQFDELNTRDMFIMGYGASGAGKTTCMFGMDKKTSDRDGRQIIGGSSIMQELFKFLPIKTSSCTMEMQEFYGFQTNAEKNDKILELTLNEPTQLKDFVKTLLQTDLNQDGSVKATGPLRKNTVDERTEFTREGVLWTHSDKGEMMEVIKKRIGGLQRKVAPTMMNDQSSRSHIIIKLEFKDILGKLYIADFAGVESIPDCHTPTIAALYERLKRPGEATRFYDSTQEFDGLKKQYGGASSLSQRIGAINNMVKYKGIKLKIPDIAVAALDGPLFQQLVKTMEDQKLFHGKGIQTNIVKAYEDGFRDFKLPTAFQKPNKKPEQLALLPMLDKVIPSTYEGLETPQGISYYYIAPSDKGSPKSDNYLDLLFDNIYKMNVTSEFDQTSFIYTSDDADSVRERVNNEAKLKRKIPHLSGSCQVNQNSQHCKTAKENIANWLNSRHSLTKEQESEINTILKENKKTPKDQYVQRLVLNRFDFNKACPVQKGNQAVSNFLWREIKEFYLDKQSDKFYIFLKSIFSPALAPSTAITSKESYVLLGEYYEAVAEQIKQHSEALQAEITAASVSLKHAEAMCMFRAAEGKVINGSLEKVRQLFAKRYKSDMSSTKLRQSESQCKTFRNKMWGDNHADERLSEANDGVYQIATTMDLILTPDNGGKELPNAVILGVFNQSWESENPANMEYTSCHELIQEYIRLRDNKFRTHVAKQLKNAESLTSDYADVSVITKFKTMVNAAKNGKIAQIGIKNIEELKNSSVIARYNLVLEQCNDTMNSAALRNLIMMKSNDNANTALGTLEFIDQACKQFLTKQTFGTFT